MDLQLLDIRLRFAPFRACGTVRSEDDLALERIGRSHDISSLPMTQTFLPKDSMMRAR
jgi:hypothetical protein